ncbi:hypothetical protein [Derxia lacustris]|uniref:hypothetical protein n=1 Tax=Derxia lacustris TaxID=764842 RepID=UPI000A16DD5C|nr:hypothetical protein [Derxia lacustris]
MSESLHADRYGIPPSLHVDVYLEGEREFWRLDEPTLVSIDGQPLVLPPDLSPANLALGQVIEAADGATVVLLLRDRVATAPGAAPNAYVAIARRFAPGAPPVCVYFHDALDSVDAALAATL